MFAGMGIFRAPCRSRPYRHCLMAAVQAATWRRLLKLVSFELRRVSARLWDGRTLTHASLGAPSIPAWC